MKNSVWLKNGIEHSMNGKNDLGTDCTPYNLEQRKDKGKEFLTY